MASLVAELKERGIIKTVSDPGIERLLDAEKVVFYTGYDPTAKSLQIGNLFAIVTMKRLQLAGHKPVILVGGATGMIGDPSGKSSERKLLDAEVAGENAAALKLQLSQFLDFNCGENSAEMVNNLDWFKHIGFLEFLRDAGKHFRLVEMLAKDSVQTRLTAGEGISFTEFAYQTLQAYDFAYLNEKKGVTLQLGGSDQWGNITAGIEYVRKIRQVPVYGMVIPLVTDASGLKFGKSAGNGIFLSADITSPYQMYQYLLNTEDACVVQYLKYFTFLPLAEIAELERELQANPNARKAQRVLAEQVTELVHKKSGLEAALRCTKIFFGEKIADISKKDLDVVFASVPAVARTPLFKSKGEARRMIEQQGAYLNNVLIASPETAAGSGDLLDGNVMVLRKGKKSYCVVNFS